MKNPYKLYDQCKPYGYMDETEGDRIGSAKHEAWEQGQLDTLQKLKELGFGKMVGCVGCDAGYHDGDCPEDTNLKCLFFVPLDIEATLKELEK
jgi:hypothetical protein